MKKIDFSYIINVEQIKQKIHIKYTFFEAGFLICASLFYLYFDSVDMAIALILFFSLIYHKMFINKKRGDYGEVYLIKKLHGIKETMRESFNKVYAQ